MALRSDKRARAAYLDALFGALLPSLPSTTHGVYQVATVTDDKSPADHPALWRATGPGGGPVSTEPTDPTLRPVTLPNLVDTAHH